jgi:hypothetical protein
LLQHVRIGVAVDLIKQRRTGLRVMLQGKAR